MPLPVGLQQYDSMLDLLVELVVREIEDEQTPETTMPRGPAKESARHQESTHGNSTPAG